MIPAFTKLCVCGKVVRILGITSALCECGREHSLNGRLSFSEYKQGENPLGGLLPDADLIKI
jgi:hypothetical protein